MQNPPPQLSQMAYYSVEKKIYPTYSYTTLRGCGFPPPSFEPRGTELTNFMKKWKFAILCHFLHQKSSLWVDQCAKKIICIAQVAVQKLCIREKCKHWKAQRFWPWKNLTWDLGGSCILLITLWPLDRYIGKGYQICCTRNRLERGKGLASISVIPSSPPAAKHGVVGESVSKCDFSHGGRVWRMRFSPTCSDATGVKVARFKGQVHRLQFGKIFIAIVFLERHLLTL
jgi:hypothetical protein